MLGILFKIGLAFAPVWLPKVLGWFGISMDDERDKERQAGEKLGKVETENAEKGIALDAVVKADAARDGAIAGDADPATLRQPRPGEAAWNPDGLG